MDKIVHYHVESGSTENGPTLSVECGQKDEMLRYLDWCTPHNQHSDNLATPSGYMKGTVKGQAFKFLFVGNAVAVNGYDYTEVRSCAGAGCAKL